MAKLHMALIGCGYWGKHFLRICQQHPNIVLNGVFDSSATRMEELRSLNPDVHFYESLDAVMADAQVQAVIIATGLTSHMLVATAALQAGKHVLCEKPLTEKASESEALGKLAADKGLTLMVGHTFEFNDAVLHAKKEIDSQRLGDLFYLSFRRCGNGPIREDADCVYDLATHDISIANFLLGGVPESVSGTASKCIGKPNYDVANFTMQYANGISVMVNVSWIEMVKQREMKVVGSNGMLLFNDVVPAEKVRVYSLAETQTKTAGDFGAFQLSVANSEVHIPKIDYREPLKEELEHFMHCIRTGEQPRTDWQNAANVVKVLEAVEASIAQNGASVKIS